MALDRDREARASREARAAARGRPGSGGRGRVRTVRRPAGHRGRQAASLGGGRSLRADLVLDEPRPLRRRSGAGDAQLRSAGGPHRGRVRRTARRSIWRRPLPIPPGPQRVTFSYSGVSLSAPDRIRFRYRLDGFDPGLERARVASERPSTPTSARRLSVPRDGLEQRRTLERPRRRTSPSRSHPRIWQTGWFRSRARRSAR